mmetsp:Transcript_100938/g.253030  ORF Transcript_100938/g.253030 Transcript_100938/m.253030 type:complete len:214 (+) Transcript_100938:362-1003(+)
MPSHGQSLESPSRPAAGILQGLPSLPAAGPQGRDLLPRRVAGSGLWPWPCHQGRLQPRSHWAWRHRAQTSSRRAPCLLLLSPFLSSCLWQRELPRRLPSIRMRKLLIQSPHLPLQPMSPCCPFRWTPRKLWMSHPQPTPRQLWEVGHAQKEVVPLPCRLHPFCPLPLRLCPFPSCRLSHRLWLLCHLPCRLGLGSLAFHPYQKISFLFHFSGM